MPSDQRVRVPATGRYVYPDVTVSRRPFETDPLALDTITNPRLIIEILSETTEAFDRGEKFVGYRSIPSLTDYLLVAQHTPRIEHFARQDDGSWVLRTYGPGSAVTIASLGIELSIDAIFAGVLDGG